MMDNIDISNHNTPIIEIGINAVIEEERFIPPRLEAFQVIAKGADGKGVPAGGRPGQVLAKNTDSDFDTMWTATGGAVQEITNEEINNIIR
jgi:hypothetical protein